MNKFKTGDKVKVVSVEENEICLNNEMKQMKGEIFTIKSITPSGNYDVEENDWIWGESNLEMVEETVVNDVQKVLKVWELEEGKEYQEVTEHIKYTKFRICNDELEYSFWNSWCNEVEDSTLGEILAYEFIEIKSKRESELEKEIDNLLQTYSKDEIVQAINDLKEKC